MTHDPWAGRPMPPGPAGAPPPPESRKERFARHRHRVRLYAGAVVFVALLSGLIVLISVNTRRVKLSWPEGSTHASLVWVILGATVLGWLLGVTTAIVFHHRTRRRDHSTGVSESEPHSAHEPQ